MTPRPRALILLAAASLAVPCGIAVAAAGGSQPCSSTDAGGSWPTYGHDAANTRTQPQEKSLDAARAAQLAPAWTFTTSGALQSTPVVSGGCVYLTTSAGLLYAIDAATGRQAWPEPAKVNVDKAAMNGGAVPGAPAVSHGKVFVLASEDSKPFAAAYDAHTGTLLWQSAPVTTQPGSYTNASAVVDDDVLVMGYSPAEGDDTGQGGVALIDTDSGAILADVPTIPLADQKQGYAGGGIWSTAAFDGHGYAYVGAGNPDSKTKEHPHTDAILKIDVDRDRATFGQVVASYKGEVDQYDDSLQQLSQTPACAASDTGMVWPLDDPVCGQLDLDFGASPNLIPDGHGGLLVGDLQKSGDYHVAHARDMSPAWHTIVGASCAVCNAASTAYDGSSVFVLGTPGGALWSLDARTGARNWAAPVADGAHYQSLSVADGVVYTVDGYGFLDGWSTTDGSVVVKRSMSADVGAAGGGLTSAGVAIADHTVFAATSDPSQSTGYLVAYR
jgi:outer membrane protein assembly factor BamB